MQPASSLPTPTAVVKRLARPFGLLAIRTMPDTRALYLDMIEATTGVRGTLPTPTHKYYRDTCKWGCKLLARAMKARAAAWGSSITDVDQLDIEHLYTFITGFVSFCKERGMWAPEMATWLEHLSTYGDISVLSMEPVIAMHEGMSEQRRAAKRPRLV